MNPFLRSVPAIPHLNRPGGLKGETFDLRRDVGPGLLATLGRNVLWSNVDGDAATWAEVMDIVELAKLGPTVTTFGTPLDIPSGTYDFRHGRFTAAFVGAGGNNVDLHAAHLMDVSDLDGASLHFVSGGSTLTWSPKNPGDVNVFLFSHGASLQNDEGPAAIPIRIPNGDNPLILGAVLGGGITNNAGPVVSLGPGAVLYTITGITTTGLVVGPGSVVSDDNTALMIHAHDGSFLGFPTNPGFLGTQLNVPLNNDGGSGPTSARPSAALIGGTLPPGWKYYDTTIDKPIVVNAANAWVDYAGNPV